MSVAEALALLKEFSNSECFSFTDQRLSEARFNATNMANMLRNDIIDVAYKPKSSNFEIATNSRRKRSTGHLERMKRQTTGNGSGQTGNTTSNNCSSLDNIFTAADVSNFYMSYISTSIWVFFYLTIFPVAGTLTFPFLGLESYSMRVNALVVWGAFSRSLYIWKQTYTHIKAYSIAVR